MKIEYLFPEITGLYGDHGNMKYLKSCLDFSAISCEIIKTGINDRPFFASDQPDLIYMGSMTEASQEIAIQTLLPWKQQLIEHINHNTLFLITGNALEVFGKSIENEDKSSIPGLNLFPTVAKRKMFDRFNSLYWGKFESAPETLDIFGFKSQFSHSWIEDTSKNTFSFTPLFNTLENKGPGLNPEISGEGIHFKRFMATYLIGPLLVINPLFTRYLMDELGVSYPVLAYEKDILKAYALRKDEFTAPGKNFYYDKI